MAGGLIIRCECGHEVHGEDESRLLAAAREHVASAHPELLGRLTDDDLLAMASAA
jgi:hypothetical protein